MRIFISSVMQRSSAGGKVLYEMDGERQHAHEVIEAMGLDPVAFEHLPPSADPSKPFHLEELARSDIAVFLVWQTVTDAVKREYEEAARLGIPRLVFVKECHGPESPSADCRDFLSTSVRPEDTGVKYSYFRTLPELGRLIKTSIVAYVTENIRNSTYRVPTSQNLYIGAAMIAESSRQRLCLCQDSPSYILPVKTTDDPERDRAEQRLYDALRKWLDRIHNNSPCRFLLLGAVDKTTWEFRRHSDQGRQYVLDRLNEFEELQREFPNFIRLGWVESYRKDMYIASAGERRYGLYVRNLLTGDPVAGFFGSNRELADAIFSYVEKTILTSTIATKDVIGMLADIDRTLGEQSVGGEGAPAA